MSYPFGAGSNVAELRTDSLENRVNQALRRAKRDSTGNAPQATKRAALGTITNQRRSQPFRAAKQVTSSEGFGIYDDENAVSTAAGKTAFSISNTAGQTQAFSIHVDEPSNVQKKSLLHAHEICEDRVLLRPELTALQPREPLSTLAPQNISIIDLDSSSDSPMILDASLNEQQHLERTRDISKAERDAIILTVPEYADDIYRYLREAEMRNRPKCGYMRKQPDITSSMRSILVDWLVEVGEEYKLHRETLFLSINYIDRFLSFMSVLRGKLQLVGAASMFLAAKYEEIYPPDVGEFVYITDDTYTKKQVLRMEHLVLKVLSFDVAVPTINCFLEKFLKQTGADDKTESLAMYLAELTMPEGETYLKYLPSQIASACLCLARHSLNQPAWTNELHAATGYYLSEFMSCLGDIRTTMINAATCPQQAIRDKYRAPKYHNVTSTIPPSTLPGQQFA